MKPKPQDTKAQQAQETQEKQSVIAKSVPKERLDTLIRHHVWSAMALGLIPLPFIDLAAVTAVQLNLLRKLAQEYGIKFFDEKGKNIVSALVGGAIPATAGPTLGASLSKLIPGLGQTFGVITLPILAGATTYAVGKVFIQHFASGGTFLTFDPEKVKAYYEDMLKEGQQVAAAMKSEPPKREEQPAAMAMKSEQPAKEGQPVITTIKNEQPAKEGQPVAAAIKSEPPKREGQPVMAAIKPEPPKREGQPVMAAIKPEPPKREGQPVMAATKPELPKKEGQPASAMKSEPTMPEEQK